MRQTPLILLLLLIACFQSQAQDQSNNFNIESLEVPFKKFTLDNGLTLLVHEDHKAPIAAVNVWYHVGSKNEPEGKTGFAHLFEHLMFNGSENYNDDYFKAMERIGATDLNGTTWYDRTNYFQNVPVQALDAALWMESDRMGHFAGAITQERLDEQRDVVKNEKRQGLNRPYGRVYEHLLKHAFPEGHPYAHSTIGSMEDLSAASLDDVKNWFRDYYGAANAVIVVAGDVNTQEVLEKVTLYFGDIPSGPPVTKQKVNIPRRTGVIKETMEDRVSQTRIYMQWNVPQYGTREATYLDLVSDVLANGKNSRLYKRLVYDEQVASRVYAYVQQHEICGMFMIQADVEAGVDKEKVESIIKEELDKLLKEGPTEKELNRVKTQYFANFARRIERIGGFGGKSDLLIKNEVYMDDAGHYKTALQTIKNASTQDLKAVANQWLSDGMLQIDVVPFPNYFTTGKDADRSKLPEVGPSVNVSFPKLQEATLSNGLRVILAQRSTVPLVRMEMIIDAGYAADQFAKPGTASMTLNMIDEGTKNMGSLEINEKLATLGATLSATSGLDQSMVTMGILKQNIDPSMELFADVILNPAFSEEELSRQKKLMLSGIQQEKTSPMEMALRVLPGLIYGPDHAYSTPLTGSGYEETVRNMQREDLLAFYNNWFKPNNATLVVTGDISMDELMKKVENHFKKWKKGELKQKNLAEVDAAPSKIYLIDKPDADQSIIIAGHTTPGGGKKAVEATMMNFILGGEFSARINMNLREDKGWAYGAYSILWKGRGQYPFMVYAPVQTDKTAESMKEIVKELKGYVGDMPATQEEFDKVKKNEVLSLAGQWETLAALERDIAKIVNYDYDLDYYSKYADKVNTLTLNEIKRTAKEYVQPEKLVWVVVGDKEKIINEIKALGYGDVVMIDADGKQLKPENQKLINE